MARYVFVKEEEDDGIGLVLVCGGVLALILAAVVFLFQKLLLGLVVLVWIAALLLPVNLLANLFMKLLEPNAGMSGAGNYLVWLMYLLLVSPALLIIIPILAWAFTSLWWDSWGPFFTTFTDLPARFLGLFNDDWAEWFRGCNQWVYRQSIYSFEDALNSL